MEYYIVSKCDALGFPGDAGVKNPPSHAGDTRDKVFIPGLERFLEIKNGNPLQYSCLENSMDKGTWWAAMHGSQKVRHD